jgi:type II secretory pathway component PulM
VHSAEPAFLAPALTIDEPATTRTQLVDLSDNVESLKAELEQARAVLCGIQDQLPAAATASAAPQASPAPVDR